MPVLLALEDVDARYGQVQALRGVSLTVAEGEIVAILGANGAGKTTTLRAISGTVRRTGKIRLGSRSLTRRGPESTARLGVAHVPEGRGTFDNAERTTNAARSSGRASTSDPLAARPIGVRAVETMTASGMSRILPDARHAREPLL